MDLAFSDEQELLRATARELLERECPMSVVRGLFDDPRGYRAELWKQMAEVGWLGLLLPERYGGAELGLLDLSVILEELGRALTPSPFFGHLLGSLAVLHSGSESQRCELLGAASDGTRILSLAIGEESGSEPPEAIRTRARRDGDHYRVSGAKHFVHDAQNADTIVVAARTGDADASGISLLLVERDAPGLTLTPLASIDPTRRLAQLRFDATPARLLGEAQAGWPVCERVAQHAFVALAADALGGARRTLESAIGHARERVQFGRPIGANQAIQHRLADMLILVEGASSLTCHAAWAVGEQLPDAALAASMAKAFSGEAYRQVTADSIQIHGGVGFTWEYDCHLYYRRARANEVSYGDATWHRERVAQLLEL